MRILIIIFLMLINLYAIEDVMLLPSSLNENNDIIVEIEAPSFTEDIPRKALDNIDYSKYVTDETRYTQTELQEIKAKQEAEAKAKQEAEAKAKQEVDIIKDADKVKTDEIPLAETFPLEEGEVLESAIIQD